MVPIGIFMETFDAERFFAPARQELSKHLGTTAVHNLAVTASRQIAPLCESGEQPIGDITSQNWRTLVDSSQPTIGLHVGELSYAPVLAWASQRLRARGEQSCNVLLLPMPGMARWWTTRAECMPVTSPFR